MQGNKQSDEMDHAVSVVSQLPDLAREMGDTAYKLISHIPALERLSVNDADRRAIKEHLAVLYDLRRQTIEMERAVNQPRPKERGFVRGSRGGI